MKGVFGLDDHLDLFEKLKSDYSQFKSDPDNAYLAYNFFVTAWHLLEWKYPDPAGKNQREKIRSSNVLLQICEHLAVGAKHFEPLSKKHKSVSSSDSMGPWAPGVWKEGVWNKKVWKTKLTLSLTGDAATAFGTHVPALEIADKTMDFWSTNV